MTLADIEDGVGVFVDANVFVYHFVGASSECTALLRRCEIGEVQGSTSALVLAEVCHRLMMIEAVERRLVAAGNVARKLGRRSDVVRRLVVDDASVQAIPAMGIEIVAVTEATMRLSLRHQSRYGLLTNDSLIVASMQQRGVRLLATADRRRRKPRRGDETRPSSTSLRVLERLSILPPARTECGFAAVSHVVASSDGWRQAHDTQYDVHARRSRNRDS
jgi:predicted nucleic acid-binding protein